MKEGPLRQKKTPGRCRPGVMVHTRSGELAPTAQFPGERNRGENRREREQPGGGIDFGNVMFAAAMAMTMAMAISEPVTVTVPTPATAVPATAAGQHRQGGESEHDSRGRRLTKQLLHGYRTLHCAGTFLRGPITAHLPQSEQGDCTFSP